MRRRAGSHLGFPTSLHDQCRLLSRDGRERFKGRQVSAQTTQQGPAWQDCAVQKYTLPGKIKTRRNLFTGHWQVVRRDPGMLLTYYTRTLCSQHSPMYSGLQDTLPNAVLTGLKVAYSVWRMVDCVMIDIGRQGHPSPRARQS